jgi:hypothetical protein
MDLRKCSCIQFLNLKRLFITGTEIFLLPGYTWRFEDQIHDFNGHHELSEPPQ